MGDDVVAEFGRIVVAYLDDLAIGEKGDRGFARTIWYRPTWRSATTTTYASG